MDTKLDMHDGDDYSLAGDMSIPSARRNNAQPGQPDFNTLDEPIKETIMRDVKSVTAKFYHVLYPKEKSTLLKEWDLWGPLLLCTFMATILQGTADITDSKGDGGPQFAQVFVIVWIGAMIVTLNSKLLGGNISFFQSVCVLGYCLAPVAGSLIVCSVLLFIEQTKFIFFLRLVVTLIGFLWSSYAAYVFLGDSQPPNRKPLAVYPIVLFYFILSWLVISHSAT
ncbi:protein YIPF6 [Contarinia nasturtii]|uniref:protein YIPF6 n=1 Tax=Contarinia nasturtii TaxID=265458 RepID=UPI0012D3DB22|nr:protein YIPF6 [Contarinia nasturtii]